MSIVTKENLREVFTHHPPEGKEQIAQYGLIRNAGFTLASAILENTPVCADQQAAIRKVREAVMTANAAIALKGGV